MRNTLLVWLPLLAILGMLFRALTVLLWGADRGFGLGDEGVYLLSARYTDDFQENVSAVYDYTSTMFWSVGYDLAAFRTFGIWVVLGSGAILGASVGRYSRQIGATHSIAVLIACFVALGSLVHYQWSYATPNYYTLTSVAVNVSIAFTIAALSAKTHRSALALWFIAGLFTGLATFVKFPTGFSLVALISFAVVLWPRHPARVRLGSIAALLAGSAAWAAFHFLFVTDLAQVVINYTRGWELFQTFGVHVPSSKMGLYTAEIARIILSAVALVWPAWLVLLAYCAVVLSWRGRGQQVPAGWRPGAAWTSILVAAAILLPAAYDLQMRFGDSFVLQSYIVAYLAGALLLLGWWGVSAMARQEWTMPTISGDFIVIAILGAAPIAGAVGTANPIFNVTGFYSAPWFAAIALLSVLLAKNPFSKMFPAVVMLGFGLYATQQITMGSVLNPSQLFQPLTAQDQVVEVGNPPSTILVDRNTSSLFTTFYDAATANGFKRGDDILAMNYSPGIVYAMGGRSPGHPAYLTGDESSIAYSNLAIAYADEERLRSAFVITKTKTEGAGDSDVSEAGEVLATRGIRFPQDFGRIVTLPYQSHYFTLWKPVKRTH